MSEMRREPGLYRTPEGGIEIVVDLDESTSWVRDMWPDEVARIEAEALPSVERLARALHDTGIGCPVRENWREIDHDALYHGPHAAAILDALRGKPEAER